MTATKGVITPCPCCNRRLLATEAAFSKSCSAITADPTDNSTPPCKPLMACANTPKSIPAARPSTAPRAVGWTNTMS